MKYASREQKNEPINNDPVNHPSHYTQGGIECIDAINAAVSRLDGYEAWLTGSVIKYMWRWKLKNGVEDLKKAQFYLNRLIQHESDNNKTTDAERGCDDGIQEHN